MYNCKNIFKIANFYIILLEVSECVKSKSSANKISFVNFRLILSPKVLKDNCPFYDFYYILIIFKDITSYQSEDADGYGVCLEIGYA